MLEAGEGDVKLVGAGVEVGEEIVASAGGNGLLVDVGGDFGKFNAGSGNGGSGGVEDTAIERGRYLGGGGGDKQGCENDEGEDVTGLHASVSWAAAGSIL
jgi:hypothetical protein